VRREIRLRAEAEREVLEAARWYRRKREGLDAEFLHALERALEAIRRAPEAKPPVPHLPKVPKHAPVVRHGRVARFPFRIVFIVDEPDVIVLAIAHESRRVGYWRRRLEEER
jgi:hypothetical protein